MTEDGRYAAFDQTPEQRDAAFKERQNEVVRAAQRQGLTILQMMDRDLDDAWARHIDHPGELLRGRIRGLAQAITLVRSPYTRQHLGPTSKKWVAAIRATEDESLARVRARKRRKVAESGEE